jgi:hypothetical protein
MAPRLESKHRPQTNTRSCGIDTPAASDVERALITVGFRCFTQYFKTAPKYYLKFTATFYFDARSNSSRDNLTTYNVDS